MSERPSAEQSLRDGDVALALQRLQEQVRAHPGDAKLRIFLFQLLGVIGQWERALTQLEVAAGLDPSALLMAQLYREALRCEVLRTQVFAGKKSPMIFGTPEPWLALLIESLVVAANGQASSSLELRAQAFDQAQAVGGLLDGQRFEWISDADSRLGPVLEAIIDGKYYWIPFSRVSEIVIDPPADLRDVVWMPAQFTFSNTGQAVGLIPTRYPGSETSEDPLLALGRRTVWRELAPSVYHGLGQRVLATDTGDYPLMDIRKITIDALAEHVAATDRA
ncbi:MAG: type VI secretion system accessory protein TagJ [Burkholderiaceae bacterium]